MEVEFKRSCTSWECDECGTKVEKDAPYWYIEISNMGQVICLCEDCGNNLQNDMSDEYQRFIDKDKQEG
jgi:NAD-dependent SIR2 family protein deacetylase